MKKATKQSAKISPDPDEDFKGTFPEELPIVTASEDFRTRETIATAAMQGIISRSPGRPDQVAERAVEYADALIKQLLETPASVPTTKGINV